MPSLSHPLDSAYMEPKGLAMTHQQALRQAHKLGIQNISHTASKTKIIRSIQKFRNMSVCFANPECHQCKNMNCEWRDDCQNHLIANSIIG